VQVTWFVASNTIGLFMTRSSYVEIARKDELPFMFDFQAIDAVSDACCGHNHEVCSFVLALS
jgi:hypothetical protein